MIKILSGLPDLQGKVAHQASGKGIGHGSRDLSNRSFWYFLLRALPLTCLGCFLFGDIFANKLVSQNLISKFPKDCYDGLNLNYESVSLGVCLPLARKVYLCNRDTCSIRSPPPGAEGCAARCLQSCQVLCI